MFVPRLRSGSWFAVVASGYWTEYMHDALGSTLRVSVDGLSRDDILNGADYADFRIGRDASSVIVTSAPISPGAPGLPSSRLVVDRVAVLVEAPDEVMSAGLTLSYRDEVQGERQVRV